MTVFSSSWWNIINIVKVRYIVSNIWKFNSLRRSSFEESFHSFLFKHMFIFLKFAWETFTFNLSEYRSFTSSFTSGKFSSKDINSIKSVLVFFELHNEKLVGLTSWNVELDKSVVDVIESSGDPFEMSVGISNFSFNPFSSGGGLFSNVSVHVSDLSEFGN